METLIISNDASACTASCCYLFANVNWLWLIIAVVVNFIIGAVWHSEKIGFGKTWMQVFKVEMLSKDQIKPYMMIIPMLTQLLAMVFMGWLYFIVPGIWGKILVMCAFGAWIKAGLMFRYAADFKSYWKAAAIEAGYFGVASVIYILASML